MIDEIDDIPTFAKRIKAKYPDYNDVDDAELVERVVRKHPVYADKVKLPDGFKLSQSTTGYDNLDSLYEQAGRTHNVPVDLLIEQGRQETINFNPDVMYGRRGSPVGAKGSGQFMPATAARFKVDVNDPKSGIDGQARYMRWLLDRFDGDEDLALAGYNAGEGAVDKFGKKVPPYKETQGYVKNIRDKVNKSRQNFTLRDLYQPTNAVVTDDSPKSTPEAPATIAVQAEAAADPTKPRAAVLLNEGETPDARDPKWTGFQAFKVPNDPRFLMVDLAAVKKLKLRNAKDIQLYIDRNPDALMRLTGRTASNVGTNTGGNQPAVKTTVMRDGQPIEATSTVVTKPGEIQPEAQAQQAQFPGGKTELTTTDDVVAGRLMPQIETLGGLEGVAPDTAPPRTEAGGLMFGDPRVRQPQKQPIRQKAGRATPQGRAAPPVSTSADLQSANEYLNSQGQPPLSQEQFDALVKSSKGYGEVTGAGVQAIVDGDKQTPVSEYEQETAVQGGTLSIPEKVAGKETSSLTGIAGIYRPLTNQTAEEASKNAFLQAGRRYGATEANWNKYRQTEQGRKDIAEAKAQPFDRIQVLEDALIKGGVDPALFQMERTQGREAIQPSPDTAGFKGIGTNEKGEVYRSSEEIPTFSEFLDQALGDRNKDNTLTAERQRAIQNRQTFSEDEAAFNKELADELKSSGAFTGIHKQLLTGFGLKAGEYLSALGATVADYSNNVPMIGLASAALQATLGESSGDVLGKFSNRAKIVNELSTPDQKVFKVSRGFGNVTGALPAYIIVGMATRNPVLTFALTDAMIAKGQGGSRQEVGVAGLKGFGTGVAFGGFSRFGKGAANAVLGEEALSSIVAKDATRATVEATAMRRIQAAMNIIERETTIPGEAKAAQSLVDRELAKAGMTLDEVLNGGKAVPTGLRDRVIDILENASGRVVARKIIEKGVPVGMAGGTGYGMVKAAGGSEEDARANALLFMAMQGLSSIFHKEPNEKFTADEVKQADGATMRVPDEQGRPRDLMLTDDNGKIRITDVTGKVPDGTVQSVVLPETEVAKKGEGFIPKLTDEEVAKAETEAKAVTKEGAVVGEPIVEVSPERRSVDRRKLVRKDEAEIDRRNVERRREAESLANIKPVNVHNLATDKNINPDDQWFKDKSAQITGGVSELDAMTPRQLLDVNNAILKGEFVVPEKGFDIVSPEAKSEIQAEKPLTGEKKSEQIVDQSDVESRVDGTSESVVSRPPTPPYRPSGRLKKIADFKTDEGAFANYDIDKDHRGRADMFVVHKDPKGYIVRNAFVPDDLQRQGLATDLYRQMNEEKLKKTGNPLRSTQPRKLTTGEVVHEMTDDAIALWDSFVKKGYAEKLDEKNYRFLSTTASPTAGERIEPETTRQTTAQPKERTFPKLIRRTTPISESRKATQLEILKSGKSRDISESKADRPDSVEAASESESKQPWMMTKADFETAYDQAKTSGKEFAEVLDSEDTKDVHNMADRYIYKKPWAMETYHRATVKRAVRQGKSVPAEVLADYPDLVKASPTAESRVEGKEPQVTTVATKGETATPSKYEGSFWEEQQNKLQKLQGGVYFEAGLYRAKPKDGSEHQYFKTPAAAEKWLMDRQKPAESKVSPAQARREQRRAEVEARKAAATEAAEQRKEARQKRRAGVKSEFAKSASNAEAYAGDKFGKESLDQIQTDLRRVFNLTPSRIADVMETVYPTSERIEDAKGMLLETGKRGSGFIKAAIPEVAEKTLLSPAKVKAIWNTDEMKFGGWRGPNQQSHEDLINAYHDRVAIREGRLEDVSEERIEKDELTNPELAEVGRVYGELKKTLPSATPSLFEAADKRLERGEPSRQAAATKGETKQTPTEGETLGMARQSDALEMARFPEHQIRAEQRQFAKDVDAVLEDAGRGEIPEVLSSAPPLLQKLGLIDAEIVMPQAVVRKALAGGARGHNIAPDVLKQLPYELNDPVMVFDSLRDDNALLILTSLENKDGHPVVAVIKYDGEIGRHKVNVIPSVHEKNRSGFVTDWAERGKLRYYNKEKGRVWLRKVGLQLPETETKLTTSSKILTDEDFVNPLEKARTAKSEARLKEAEGKDFTPEDIAGIKSKVTKHGVELDEYALELANRIAKKALKTGKFDGVFLNPEEVRAFIKEADLTAAALEGDARKAVTKLADDIEKRYNKVGVATIYTYDDAQRHETFHEGDYLGSLDEQGISKSFEVRYDGAYDTLQKSEPFDRFHKALVQKREAPLSHGASIAEAIAYLGDGRYGEFDKLTKDESVDILATIVTGYATENGVESLKHFEQGTHLYEVIEQFGKEQSSERSDDSRSEVSSEREAGSEAVEAKPDDTGNAERAPESKKGEEKLASLPQTLRKYGRQAVDVLYTVHGHTESTDRAVELFEKNGVQGSINLLDNLLAKDMDAEHTILAGLIYDTLEGAALETNDPILTADADGFLEQIAQRLVQAGRVVDAVQVIEHAPQVSVMRTAENRANETGGGLNSDQAAMFADLGRQLENAYNEVVVEKQRGKTLAEEVARLEAENAVLKSHKAQGSRGRRRIASVVKAKYGKEIDAALSEVRNIVAAQAPPHLGDETLQMARKSRDPLIDKLAVIGAGKLVKGLAADETYLPEAFQREMETHVDPAVLGPIFDEVYEESIKVRDKWLKEIATDYHKARFGNREQAELEKMLGRSLPEKLTDKDVLDLLGLNREAARRRNAIEAIHRLASGARKANVTNEVRQLIANEAGSEMEAKSALLHALNTPVDEFYEALGGKTPETKKAFVEGRKLLDKVNEAIKDHKAEVKQKVAEQTKMVSDANFAEIKARENLGRIKRDLADELEALTHPKTHGVKKLWVNTFDLLRELGLSLEMSFLGRQGGKFLRSEALTWLPRYVKAMNPQTEIRRAHQPARASGKTLLPFIGERFYANEVKSIENDVDFAEAVKMGLDFSTAGKLGTGVKVGEEQLQPQIMDRAVRRGEDIRARVRAGKANPLKLAYGPVELGARFYIRFDKSMAVFLDKMRLKMYKLFSAELKDQGYDPKTDKAQFEEMARRVNTGTSRPNKFDPKKTTGRVAQKTLDAMTESRVGLAPQYTVAKWQDMGADARNTAQSVARLVTFNGLPKGAQRIAMKKAMQSYGALMLQYALIGAAFGALVSLDPDDDDFLKVKIGEYRYDLTQGNRSELKYIGQLIKHAGSPQDALKNTLKYMRGRLNILPGFAINAWTGTDMAGNDFKLSDPKVYAKLVVPFTYMNAIQAYQKDGLKGVGLILPAEFVGLQTSLYPDRVGDIQKQINEAKAKGKDTTQLESELLKAKALERTKEQKKNIEKFSDLDMSQEEFVDSDAYKKSTTDDLVDYITGERAEGNDTKTLEDALKKKVKNAQKANTFTQDEADRVNEVLETDYKKDDKNAKEKDTTGKVVNPDGLLDYVWVYAKAMGTDPKTAFNRIFTGQVIKRVDNDAVIVERMSKDDSEAEKQSRAAKKGMKLDHTIPLELGGDNSRDNLNLVSDADWKRFTPVENALATAMRQGKINKARAQELMVSFKNKWIGEAEITEATGIRLGAPAMKRPKAPAAPQPNFTPPPQ